MRVEDFGFRVLGFNALSFEQADQNTGQRFIVLSFTCHAGIVPRSVRFPTLLLHICMCSVKLQKFSLLRSFAYTVWRLGEVGVPTLKEYL